LMDVSRTISYEVGESFRCGRRIGKRRSVRHLRSAFARPGTSIAADRMPRSDTARDRNEELQRSESSNIVDEHIDVLVRQRLRGGCHVAIEVRARLGLEAAQLRFQILELLPGESRDVLLTKQRGAVTLRAVKLLRELGRP